MQLLRVRHTNILHITIFMSGIFSAPADAIAHNAAWHHTGALQVATSSEPVYVA